MEFASIAVALTAAAASVPVVVGGSAVVGTDGHTGNNTCHGLGLP